MSLLKGFTDELKATAAVAPLGIAANELLDSQVTKVGKFADTPIRLYAAFPTPDSKLYFRASAVQQGDGSSRIIPPIDDKLIASVDGSLEFQGASPTITGITLTRDGAAYTHPTATVGQFVRMAFVRKGDGSFDAKATAGLASLGAIQAIDPGTLWSALDGMPNGYIDLECTAVGPVKFKTAGSATDIIENSVGGNSRIFGVGAGGGAGGGADRTYKVSSITATVATIKGGYRGIDDKRVLSSGTGVTALTAGADVSVTMATLLTQSSLSFVADKIYALVIDLATVAAPVALDNKRQVIVWDSTNLKLLDQADLTLIDPRRYVVIDQIYVPAGAVDWATAQLIQWTQQVHDTLASYFPYVQRYAAPNITSATASNVLTHGLDGEPQIVQVFYYDGTNKNGKDLSSHLVNKNATQLVVSSLGLTFGGSQYLEVVAFYVPTVPNVASAQRTFTSPWYQSNAVTTVPHGLSDMEDIRGVQVQEWDVSGGKRRVIDTSALIVDFDATNFYLNWTGLSPSATKQYRFFVGGSPIPWSIRDGAFDSITDASGAGAPDFPNGATGIETGINGSPIVYKLTKQAIGEPGTSGQKAAGHVLSVKSFPAALVAQPTKYSFYNFAANAVDGNATNAKDLTNVGSTPFSGTNINGVAASVADLNGSSQYFSSTNAFFSPGNGKSWAVGAWFAADDWSPAADEQMLFSNIASGADRCFYGFIDNSPSGDLTFAATNTAGSFDANITIPNPGFVDGSWHHVAMVYDFTASLLKIYIDGKMVASTFLANTRVMTSPAFRFGADLTAATEFFDGRIGDGFFINDYLMTDDDMRKLYSYRLDHALGVSVTNQKWSANLYGAEQTDHGDSLSPWLVDLHDNDSLFLDFDRSSTDQVELFMEDRSLSPTTVGSVVPYDVIHTVNPTFPLAHGQAGVPELVAEGELTSGVWEPVSLTGHVKADSTNLDGSLTALFTAGYLRVRLVARNVGPVQTGVPLATTGLDGLIGSRAKGHQKMGGLKGFEDGAYSVGNVRDAEGAGTTTLSDNDKRHQVFNLSAGRTCVLPSTSILKGDEWTLENRTSFLLTVQASGGLALTVANGANQAGSIASGNVKLVALQDAPTLPSHWRVSRTVHGSTLTVTGAAYTSLDDDGYDTLLFSTGASDRNYTPPSAANNVGRRLLLVKIDSGAGGVALQGTISGHTLNNTIKAQFGRCRLVSDGTQWLYEEDICENGLVAVTLNFNGGNGTATWTANSGKYRRNGRSIAFVFEGSLAKGDRTTQVLSFTNLPFVAVVTETMPVSVTFTNITNPAGTQFIPRVANNTTTVAFSFYGAGAAAGMTAAALATTVTVSCNGTYCID